MEIFVLMESDSLNNFIDDRLQDNYFLLQKKAEYVNLNNKLNSQYRNFVENLSAEDLRILENIIDMKSCLLSEEVYLSYKIGFSDGMKFSKEIKQQQKLQKIKFIYFAYLKLAEPSRSKKVKESTRVKIVKKVMVIKYEQIVQYVS